MASERDRRVRQYLRALELAKELGVTVGVERPPAPDQAALRAYNQKYGEGIRQDAAANKAKLARLLANYGVPPLETLDSPTDGTEESEAERVAGLKALLNLLLSCLRSPEREYRMVAR